MTVVASSCRPLMSLRLSTALTVVVVASSTAWAQSTDSTSKKSTLAGVYTEEQATKGDSEHQANRVARHGAENSSGEKFVRTGSVEPHRPVRPAQGDDARGQPGRGSRPNSTPTSSRISSRSTGRYPAPRYYQRTLEALRLIKIEMKAPGQGLAERRKPSARQVVTTSAIRLSAMYHPHSPASPSAKR